MNRQLKRANEKSDKRREREQQRRKEQRRENRVRTTQTKRSAPAKSAQVKDGKDGPGNKDKRSTSGRNERAAPGTGRSVFNTAYLLFTTVVIVSQAFVPQQTTTLSFVTHVFIYLILGYFFALWLYRRGVTQALMITLLAGFGLSLGVEGLKALLPQLGFPQLPPLEGASSAPNPLYVALAVPGLLAGTWLGRYIYKRS